MALERELRDEAMFDLIRLKESDPNFALQVAHIKGKVAAIQEIWSKRHLIRKSKPVKKGSANANYEKSQEADEDEFDLEDY